MNGSMDSGSLVLPSSQEFLDRDDPGAPQPQGRALQAQAPGLDCHLPGDSQRPSQAASLGVEAGCGGQGGGDVSQSPRCSAAQHHDSAAATEPAGRQVGGQTRGLEAGNRDGASSCWDRPGRTGLSLGHRWAHTSTPGGRPQAGFSLAVQNPRSHAAGRRWGTASMPLRWGTGGGQTRDSWLQPPCQPRPPPPHRPPDRLPGPIC